MPHMEKELRFTGPPQEHSFVGLLFDMDGTIIDSTAAIVKHWTAIGKELGIDPDVILATSHGRRSVDVLEALDPSKANWDYVCAMEAQLPEKYGNDAVELPGSRALLDSLDKVSAPWAIVTSGTKPLVTGWLSVLKLAQPKYLVTAEDVPRGKPDPACYLLGHSKLGLPRDGSARTLVLEDAPAGVKAGKAAGFDVVALATTHAVGQLRDAGADWIVKDLRSVRLKRYDQKTGEARIEITGVLED